MKYLHPSGFGLGIGIKTRQISEWYDATVTTNTPLEISSDSAAYVIINGFQQFTNGTLTGTQIDRTIYHTPIKRIYIDIPLELSYQKRISKLEYGISLSTF